MAALKPDNTLARLRFLVRSHRKGDGLARLQHKAASIANSSNHLHPAGCPVKNPLTIPSV